MAPFDAPVAPGDYSSVRWIQIFLLLCLLLITPAIACAQATQPRSDPLRVFLITFGPGADPWEKFGHDSIAIEDADAMTSVAYNWGVFDFGQGFGGFVTFGLHFLQGRLLYSMRSEPTDEMLDAYKAAGRSTLVQEIRLTPGQKLDLKNRLEANDTDANRYYLYDYFHRNCATMARGALDQTVDGRIAAQLKKIPTGTTYRWHDRRASADTLWLYFFLDYALGHLVDRPLSAWEESFLPGKFALHLQSVQVPDLDGKLVPIVVWQKQLSAGVFVDRPVPPTSYFYAFLATGLTGGLILCGLCAWGGRQRVGRYIFILVVMLWSVPTGALGGLLTYAWFSNHEAAKWNENWLQASPLSLLLIVVAPMLGRWPRLVRGVALGVVGLSGFGLVMKITPWFWQVNGSIIALALPIHGAAAWGVWRLTRRHRQPTILSAQSNDVVASAI